MTKNSRFLNQSLYPLLDLILAGIFAYYAPYVTNWVAPLFGWQPSSFFNLFTASPFLAGAALMSMPLCLRQIGFYRKQNMQRPITALRQLFAFVVYYLCAMGLYTAIFGTPVYHSQILLINLIGIPMVVFLRYLFVRTLNNCSVNNAENRRQVILLGDSEVLQSSWQRMPYHWQRNLNVVGEFTSAEGNEEALQNLIETYHVAELYVFGGLAAHHKFLPLIEQCEA